MTAWKTNGWCPNSGLRPKVFTTSSMTWPTNMVPEREPCRGQSSITARYKLAKRVARRWREGIRTRILCVADYDKHSDAILAAVAADTSQHLRDMGIEPDDCLSV